MFAAPILFLLFYVCNAIILSDFPTIWGDVTFYYQTATYSQLAGVILDFWPKRGLLSPPPHLQKFFVTFQKYTKTVYAKQCKQFSTSWLIIGAASTAGPTFF
jgi:hypothetical protein